MEGTSKLRRISDLLDCCICHEPVTMAHMCPKCSQPFCQRCIDHWLDVKRTCPCCRLGLTKKKLMKACFIDQISESLREEKPAEEDPEQCAEHRQTLLLFCTSCQQFVCAVCLYSTDHEDHKDRVLLLENAIEQYFTEIANSTKSIEEEIDEHQRMIKKLSDEKQRIELFVRAGKQVEKKVAIMAEILKFREKGTTRSPTSTNAISKLSEPTHFEFRLANALKTIAAKKFVETVATSETGLKWKFSMVTSVNGPCRYKLCLVEGPPGVYQVAIGSTEAVLYSFSPGIWVDLVQDYEKYPGTRYSYLHAHDEMIFRFVIRFTG